MATLNEAPVPEEHTAFWVDYKSEYRDADNAAVIPLVPLEGNPAISFKTRSGFLRAYIDEHGELIICAEPLREPHAGIVVRPESRDWITVDLDA